MGRAITINACFRTHVFAICLLMLSLYSQAHQQTDGKSRWRTATSAIEECVLNSEKKSNILP